MEVVLSSGLEEPFASWSLLECLVLLGWLSLPLTCCAVCGLCIFRPITPRQVRKGPKKAETQTQFRRPRTHFPPQGEGNVWWRAQQETQGGKTPHSHGHGLQGHASTTQSKQRSSPTVAYMGQRTGCQKRKISIGHMLSVGGPTSRLNWWPSESVSNEWAVESMKNMLNPKKKQSNPDTAWWKHQEDQGLEKGSMRKAMEVAEKEDRISQAVDKLKEGYWSKRREIMELTRKVVPMDQECLPLARSTIERVAAAIKVGGMKSGDQYVNELKLWHIEEGHPVPPWMGRLITLCKKSLNRNKGPVKRAKEFQVENLGEEMWLARPESNELCNTPALSYAWACVWMLRCVELCNCRWEHVTLSLDKSAVKLFLPKSKMDQSAGGVTRTLKCCGETPCSRFCAYGVANSLMVRRGFEENRKGPMWTSSRGIAVNKSEMISSWRWLCGKAITGHSARRSGAMAYVRLGLPIQELAFLGRWKSAVVLTYAEEALQTHPANSRIMQNCSMVKAAKPKSKAKAIKEVTQPTKVIATKPSVMWVAANGYKATARVWHRVAAAGWNMPMHKWTTACGWCFTEKSANVSLTYTLPLITKKCKKCGEAKSACDGVKEGIELAGLMCNSS